jgi:hypothetical protein
MRNVKNSTVFRRTVLSLTVMGTLIAASHAHACGSGGGGAGLAIAAMYGVWGGSLAGSGVATAAYTISDMSRAIKKTAPDRKHGASEIMTMSMATTVGVIYAGTHLGFYAQERANGWGDTTMLTVGILGLVEAVWSGALMVHGISEYSRAVKSSPAETPAPPPPQRQISLAPTMVTDGSSRGVGLAVVGRF